MANDPLEPKGGDGESAENASKKIEEDRLEKGAEGTRRGDFSNLGKQARKAWEQGQLREQISTGRGHSKQRGISGPRQRTVRRFCALKEALVP
jgi:hypothetical protein